MFDFVVSFFRYLISPRKKLYRQLRNVLGFYPKNLHFYEIALVHKSASIVKKDGIVINNERLEFLGDAILDAVISDYLYHKFPNESEGFLTQMRSKIVNGSKLNELARRTKLHKIIIANTQQQGSKTHISGDAFEAIIGAMYLDKGYHKTFNYIINHILKKFIDIGELESLNTNYKSQLIEWGQKYKVEVDFYTDYESPGSKYFISYIRIEQKNYGSGIGISKKEAEQKAAKAALEQLVNYQPTKQNQVTE